MKNVLVIGSRFSGTKNDPSVIAQSIASDIVVPRLVYWEDLVFDISTNNVSVTVEGADLFSTPIDLVIAVGWYKSGARSLYRDVAYSFALVLADKGITYWNTEMGNQRSTSKLSTMVHLALNDISVPRTLFSLSSHLLEGMLSFPFIAKAVAASRGNLNFLIKDASETARFVDEKVYFILQPFLLNDHDLRVICFGGKPNLVLKRSRGESSNTHLNNTSQGGNAEWIPLSLIDSRLLTFCEKISTISGREMAGIDLIPDESAPYGYSCLEINAVPQLTSGTDTDKKMTAFREALRNL